MTRQYTKPPAPEQPTLQLFPSGLGNTTDVESAIQDGQGGIHVTTPENGSLFYQHTVLCQTSMPYRNPGDETRVWDRKNGRVHMRLKAGDVLDPERGEMVELGLPWGAKPRLITAYISTQCVLTQDATIEVEDTFRQFVLKLGYSAQGHDFRTMKDQLSRLSASDITFAVSPGADHSAMFYGRIVKSFDLWLVKDARQRLLWPSTLTVSTDYFESLMSHAVPLPEQALIALKGSAVQLDIYCWLAQRLHRIKPDKFDFLPWTALYAQFGQGYSQIRRFRAKFLDHLKAVHGVYATAKIEADGKGLYLHHSPPPVPKRHFQVISHRP